MGAWVGALAVVGGVGRVAPLGMPTLGFPFLVGAPVTGGAKMWVW